MSLLSGMKGLLQRVWSMSQQTSKHTSPPWANDCVWAIKLDIHIQQHPSTHPFSTHIHVPLQTKQLRNMHTFTQHKQANPQQNSRVRQNVDTCKHTLRSCLCLLSLDLSVVTCPSGLKLLVSLFGCLTDLCISNVYSTTWLSLILCWLWEPLCVHVLLLVVNVEQLYSHFLNYFVNAL